MLTQFWYRYPGVQCDIPSLVYQSTFAPNEKWSEKFARGPESTFFLPPLHESRQNADLTNRQSVTIGNLLQRSTTRTSISNSATRCKKPLGTKKNPSGV